MTVLNKSRVVGLAAVAVAVCALLVAAAALPGVGAGVLFAAPALVLFALLVVGWAPGADRLERFVARVRHSRRRALPILAPRAAPRRLAAGGLLLALSLATRPPPAAAFVVRS